MHLQQTKKASRDTGGPQYYFHDLPAVVKEFLRNRGACPVLLETPYGIARSPFMAVGRDHKLVNGKVVSGKVGHDRIQQATAAESIGEAIRNWYSLPVREDFDRIDVEVRIHSDGHFIMAPVKASLSGRKRSIELEKPVFPLSFHSGLQSNRWKKQIESVRAKNANALVFVRDQIKKVVAEHETQNARRISEADLLRTAGAFHLLGLQLGPYLLAGYDCAASSFQFQPFPEYCCPVEIKKRSRDFSYQIEIYSKLPRVVVLCLQHDLVNLPEDVDVIELRTFAKYLSA
jgi:hypothetical protein